MAKTRYSEDEIKRMEELYTIIVGFPMHDPDEEEMCEECNSEEEELFSDETPGIGDTHYILPIEEIDSMFEQIAKMTKIIKKLNKTLSNTRNLGNFKEDS